MGVYISDANGRLKKYAGGTTLYGTTGQSTTAGMTQKAITDELNKRIITAYLNANYSFTRASAYASHTVVLKNIYKQNDTNNEFTLNTSTGVITYSGAKTIKVLVSANINFGSSGYGANTKAILSIAKNGAGIVTSEHWTTSQWVECEITPFLIELKTGDNIRIVCNDSTTSNITVIGSAKNTYLTIREV